MMYVAQCYYACGLEPSYCEVLNTDKSSLDVSTPHWFVHVHRKSNEEFNTREDMEDLEWRAKRKEN